MRHLGHRQGNLTPRLHHLLRSSAISRRDYAKRYEGVYFPKRGNARYGPTGCPIRSKTARRGPTGCFHGVNGRVSAANRRVPCVNAAAKLGCNKTHTNEAAPSKGTARLAEEPARPAKEPRPANKPARPQRTKRPAAANKRVPCVNAAAVLGCDKTRRNEPAPSGETNPRAPTKPTKPTTK